MGKLAEKILAKVSRLSFVPARTATNDPFVYRLGLQIFILARRVRLPYGSPCFSEKHFPGGDTWSLMYPWFCGLDLRLQARTREVKLS
jgi:hypothetical protein